MLEDLDPGPIVDRLNQIGLLVSTESGLQDRATGRFFSRYKLRAPLTVWSRKTKDEIGEPDEEDDEPKPADHGETVIRVNRKGWRFVATANG